MTLPTDVPRGADARDALSQLPPDWQQWLRLNVARGCSAESMLPLLEGGGIAPALAAAALAQLRRPARRPQPRGGPNRIHLGDCAVQLRLALDEPQVLLYDDLLGAAECEALIALGAGRLAPSTVVDDAGGPPTAHAHRSSAGCFFRPGEAPLLQTLARRAEALLQWPASHAEGVQLLRYGVGGEYRAHFDFFDPAKPGSAAHLAVAGQRVGTLVVYLDEVAEGGGTRFPTLGLQVQPRRGAALYFADVLADGTVDPRSLHAGEPVMQGVKHIATLWLREHAFPLPAGATG